MCLTIRFDPAVLLEEDADMMFLIEVENATGIVRLVMSQSTPYPPQYIFIPSLRHPFTSTNRILKISNKMPNVLDLTNMVL